MKAKTKKEIYMTKKIFTSLILAGTMACAFAACNVENENSKDAFALKDAKDIYAYSAVSAISVLTCDISQTATITPYSTVANAISGKSSETDETKYQDYVERVNKYMAIAENLMSGGGFSFEEIASDRTEYDNQIIISYADITYQTLTYKMYYNATEMVDEDGEVEIDMVGVLVNGEYEYALVGNQEREDGESELELVVQTSAKDYVAVEFEKEKKRFGGKEIEIEILKDGKITAFELKEKIEGNNTYIEGKAIENGERFAFLITVSTDEQTGESFYNYDFGSKELKKSRHGHYHGNKE